jgi:hypothetical protein
VDGLDELMFCIGLKCLKLITCLVCTGFEALLNGSQVITPVEIGFALAQKIEIGSVQKQDGRHQFP